MIRNMGAKEISRSVTDEGRPYWIDYVNEDGRFKIAIKWDGCAHLHMYPDGPEDDREYLHICDIRAFVEFIKEAFEMADRDTGGVE